MIKILFAAFVTSIIINISYWIFLYSRLLFHKSNRANSNQSLTILVVFKNASQYIKSCISSLLSQNDVQEIVLVNDFSDDSSAEYAKTIQSEKLKLIHAKNDHPGKKLALQEGIHQAETEVVLLTDVDCNAASNDWANKMQSHIIDGVDIVLGYSPVRPENYFLNRFIRFETWMTAVQYMSYATAKMPYMGVGRNLGYRRSIATNFEPDLSVLSGDDDLFISAKATADNTSICLDPDSFVFTEGKKKIGEFYAQKRRHMTTSHHYKFIHKGLLTLFSLSQMLVFPLALILLLMNTFRFQILLLLIIYVLIKWALAYPLLKRFKEDNLFFLFPILDICLSMYYWIMSLTIFTPKKTWN